MAGPDRRGEELIGMTLGQYRVEYRLGAGATGVVFRGRDTATGAIVALKVLNENLGTISSLRGRFEREARLLTKLEHPNIVHIANFGVQDTYTFIAMELLEGRTLEDALDEAPLDPLRAIEVMTEMLRGLAFAHAKEIVHRDLKPANVFLVRPTTAEPPLGTSAPQHDRVKLLDFGLAKLLSDDGGEGEDGTLTRKGRIVGTPAYMAPEQITGVSLDVRADVYASGILLYELLADRRPFLSDRRSELLRAHLLAPPPPLETVREGLTVHPELEGLVQKALEKNPNDRFPSAQAMLDALLALPPKPARMPSGDTSPNRARSGATSEIISSGERRAVSESISGSSDPAKGTSPRTLALGPVVAEAAARTVAEKVDVTAPLVAKGEPVALAKSQRDQSTGAFPTAPQHTPQSGLSTPMLYVLAVLLFAIAGALWITVGPS